MSESLVPRPDIHDSINIADGDPIEINLDNCMIVLHRNGYERMDHVRVRRLGGKFLMIFKIGSSPLGEYLMHRGYDILVKNWPDDATAKAHLEIEFEDGMKELEDGTGHELED